jgi:GMP synthase-like glutamine amidotransferase
MKYHTAAIFYHVNQSKRTDAACTGHITRYLEKHNFEVIDYYWVSQDDLPENTNDYDVVFVLGESDLVQKKEGFEWYEHELFLLEQRIIKQKKTIGIGLGAEMLILASGGHVKKNTYYELGFHPVKFLHDTEHFILKNIPKSEMFIHWHHNGFCPPAGAISIATSDACEKELYDDEAVGSQAFVYDSFLGLQFHPEMTLETFQSNIDTMPEKTERYCHSKSLMQDIAPIYLASENDPSENCARDTFFRLLDNFLIEDTIVTEIEEQEHHET